MIDASIILASRKRGIFCDIDERLLTLENISIINMKSLSRLVWKRMWFWRCLLRELRPNSVPIINT